MAWSTLCCICLLFFPPLVAADLFGSKTYIKKLLSFMSSINPFIRTKEKNENKHELNREQIQTVSNQPTDRLCAEHWTKKKKNRFGVISFLFSLALLICLSTDRPVHTTARIHEFETEDIKKKKRVIAEIELNNRYHNQRKNQTISAFAFPFPPSTESEREKIEFDCHPTVCSHNGEGKKTEFAWPFVSSRGGKRVLTIDDSLTKSHLRGSVLARTRKRIRRRNENNEQSRPAQIANGRKV